jgi:fructose-bisphosphate aldolase class II
MAHSLLHLVPERVRAKLGSASTVCLLNGRDIFRSLANDHVIVMACNPRIKHVIPGIMKAAQELDAVVAFELTRTEGGIDGGYTGQTPETFFATVIEYAERCSFSKPFIIHGDHITVKDDSAEELEQAAALIEAEIAAGYTSFALDASFNPLKTNIDAITCLAAPISAAGYALEVELGEVTTGGSGSNLTSVTETEEFLSGLAASGIKPQLLAIDNGSKSGNYLDGELIRLDLERTGEIYQVALAFGLAGLVQHGITGTPLRLVGKLAEYGIRKGNIGTLWQNVAHAGLPLDLMDAMRSWSRAQKQDIKYATNVFRKDIDAIPVENAKQIEQMAYGEAREFLAAFRSKGSASRLVKALEGAHCES